VTGLYAIIPHIQAFRKLSTEDMLFYQRFTPIWLEHFIGHKGSDPALEMIKKSLKPGELTLEMGRVAVRLSGYTHT
jgi:hypothetical protein